MSISKEELTKLRKDYPVGCKVVLEKMNDDWAPTIGTEGIVTGVDDIGSIHVAWDNGSSLAIVYKEDKCRRID